MNPLPRILAGLPSTLVGLGFLQPLIRGQVPRSLSSELGTAAIVWVVGIILSTLICGVLGFVRRPGRLVMWRLRLEVYASLVAATLLAGTGVALVAFSPTSGVTAGFALGAAALYVARWRHIADAEIPAVQYLRSLDEEK